MRGWRGSDPRNMLIVPTETVTKVAATIETTIFVTACGRLYIGHYNGKDKGTLKQVCLFVLSHTNYASIKSLL